MLVELVRGEDGVSVNVSNVQSAMVWECAPGVAKKAREENANNRTFTAFICTTHSRWGAYRLGTHDYLISKASNNQGKNKRSLNFSRSEMILESSWKNCAYGSQDQAQHIVPARSGQTTGGLNAFASVLLHSFKPDDI